MEGQEASSKVYGTGSITESKTFRTHKDRKRIRDMQRKRDKVKLRHGGESEKVQGFNSSVLRHASGL
jgi:hypothetical protein